MFTVFISMHVHGQPENVKRHLSDENIVVEHIPI